jgi:integrase
MAYVRKRGKFFSARWRTRQGLQAEKGGFASKREAEQFAEEQEALERRGKNTRPSEVNMTVREFVQEIWGPSLDVEPQTKIDYENIYNSHIDPEFGHRPIASITPSDIQKWRVRLKNTVATTGYRLKPSYIEKLTNQLGAIFRVAMDNEVIHKNPMSKIKRRKPKTEKRIVPLDMQTVQALANGFAPRWQILVWIGFFTGMRPSEILGLTWDRLDFENQEITIDRQLSRDGQRVFADHLKTTKSYRKIPFSPYLQRLLLEHKAAHGLGPHGLILQNRSGNIWRYKDASAMFRLIARPLGFDKGEGLHQLRHTCASVLIKLGNNAKQIQEWLGHESILETMDTYGHLFPRDLHEVSERLDAYVVGQLEIQNEQRMLA